MISLGPKPIARSGAGRKRFFTQMLAFLGIFALGLHAPLAQAAALIQDAEIEDTLHRFEAPIIAQAGLNAGAVRIFIINDPAINAFVAGGANIFVHTGLMLATKDAGMLVGVLAHETGHIAGGHLIRGKEMASGANMGLLIATVLGAAAAIGGGGQAAMGAMTAGQSIAQRSMMSFSRTQESSADQAALRFLDGAQISAEGMLEMFETLRQKEARQFGTIDPYALTHPLTQDRITHIRSHVMQSVIPKDAMPADFAMRHARLVAKLYGFMEAPEYTLATYPTSDPSLPAHMARAVAYFRQPNLPKAVAELDAAQKLSPHDAFLLNLRGQIMIESGKVKEAVDANAEAVKLMPNQAALQTDYAKALLALEDPKRVTEAMQALERSTAIDPDHAEAWDLLAIAYGKLGRTDRALVAQAEGALLRNRPQQALSFLKQAKKTLPPNTPIALRADDLRDQAEEQKKAMHDEGRDEEEESGRGRHR